MKSKKQINTDIKKAVNEDKFPSRSNAEFNEKKANYNIKELFSCVPISFSRCSKVAFVIYLAFIIAAMIIIPLLIRVCYPIIKEWFSISDGYDAAYLTSTILIAVVTVIYVVFTYFIFVATNKNTQQTSNAQKIAYLERKLEHFYLPIQTALERFDIDRMFLGFQDPEMTTPQHIPYLYFEIINTWWGFRTDYDKSIPFTYLASDETKKTLKDFTYIFESNRLFAKKYTTYIKEDKKIYTEINALYEDGWGDMFNADVESVFLCYKSLSDAIEKDIIAISNNLAELVNQ